MMSFAEPPEEPMVRLAAEGERATEDPVPVKVTLWGEPLTLSVIVRVPVRFPTAVGVKVAEIVQFAAAARLDPQVFVSAKSPDAVMELMESAADPEFVSITV
jgi:hypothetical protein